MSQQYFERAARHVTPEAVRDTLMDMVNINSPTGGERGMAEYIVDRLRRAGVYSYLQEISDGRPNAIGVLHGEGGGLNLLLTGHMDTTWHGDEPFLTAEGHKPKAIYRDGWVWGLGANNMKSGLASALVAVEAIAREGIKLKGDLLFGGVVGEIEKASIEEFQGEWLNAYGAGTRYMITHGVTADYAILCEPTALRVCTVNMGAIWAKISTSGTLSHAGRTNDPPVVNAIDEMHHLYARLRGWIERYSAQYSYKGEHPNVTVSAIRGGMPWRASANAFECRLYIDIRLVPGTTVEDVRRSLWQMLREFARERDKPAPMLEFYVTDPATVLPDDSPIVGLLRDAHKRVTDQEAGTFIRRAGSDAVHMNSYGVPCIVYGPGGRTHPQAKSLDASGDHASVDNLVAAAKVYLNSALTICSRSAGQR
jgi:acetylornithine deacetylase/succinyl-diaminopimelate desuccinylase-like protein